MSHRCTTCHAPLTLDTLTGAGLRCYMCGEVIIQDSGLRGKREIGIHPALAKRYQTQDADGLQETQWEEPVATLVPPSKPASIEKKIRITPPLAVPAGSIFEPPSRHRTRIIQDVEPISLPLIPGYEVTHMVGSGAMGSVYRAVHLRSGREAAVKVLAKELAQRDDLVARFEREAAALRTFRHPNVVAIFDSGFYQGAHYYCMEFCHGITLREQLKKGPLAPAVAIQCMQQVLQGLAAAHDRGIIHRDLKPENVMVEQGRLPVAVGFERVLLVDFGLADILHEAQDPHPNLTLSRVTMGTVNYMAPEQHLDAKHVDHRTDLYACGVILYECLTGDLPIGRFALPHERDPTLPKTLDACLLKALARAPAERFQSATDFEKALQQIQLIDSSTISRSLPMLPPVALAEPVVEQPPVENMQSAFKGRPKLVWGLLSLAIGWVVGFVVASQPPLEAVLGYDKATPLYSGATLKAPGLMVGQVETGELDVGLEEMGEKAKRIKWQGNSPVWQLDKTGPAFMASQGDVVHMRRDMSMLQAPTILPRAPTLSLTANLRVERVRLPVSMAKAQYWAQEVLGGSIDERGGGLFLLQADGKRAIGLIYLLEEGCAVVELAEQNGLMRIAHLERGSCKSMMPAKSSKLTLNCDAAKQECAAFVDNRVVGKLPIVDLQEHDWKMALGCQNANCFFGSAGRSSPKP